MNIRLELRVVWNIAIKVMRKATPSVSSGDGESGASSAEYQKYPQLAAQISPNHRIRRRCPEPIGIARASLRQGGMTTP
jgi:hypothetical protein